MKIKYFLTLIILIYGFSNVKSQIKDVPGFLDTRWGMTEQEILDVMKDRVIKLKARKDYRFNWYATLGMKEYVLDSNKYSVYFLMNNKTNKLEQVNLNIFYQNIEDNYKSFESLKKALSLQYGPPTAEEIKTQPKTNMKILRAVWFFPSTIILYTAWSSNFDKLMLQFIENNGKKTLKSMGFETSDSK